MRRGLISQVDEYAFDLAGYLRGHPEFEPELTDMRIEILDSIVKFVWKAPGWQESINLLRNLRFKSE